MPSYDYVCTKCGTEFTVTRSYQEAGQVKCPECRSSKVKKLIQNVAVIFKGDGFTKTHTDLGE